MFAAETAARIRRAFAAGKVIKGEDGTFSYRRRTLRFATIGPTRERLAPNSRYNPIANPAAAPASSMRAR